MTNALQADVKLSIDGRDILVHRARMAAADRPSFVYSVWEAEAGHSTIMRIDGVRYGKTCTAPLPAELEALPYGPERSEKVPALFLERHAWAQAAILVAFPHLRELHTYSTSGEISTYGEEG